MKTKETILKEIFNYDSFRQRQDEIIDSTFENGTNGVLAVLPTGGGKSLLFQIPALMQDGLSIVVSPLISLMKDQVDELRKRGVEVQTYNSSLSEGEKEAVINSINLGQLQLLYVAPERFDDDDFVFLLKNTGVNVFAVDESHCISAYGNDFRPSYKRLKRAIDKIKPKQIIAVTATATPIVQNDICVSLGIASAKRFVTGFSRDNLSIKIKMCDESEKFDEIAEQVAEYVKQGHTTGIIYAGTRKNAEYIANELKNTYGIPATFYHAGMTASERTKIQDDWFMNGGIIVATNSFGMGINKADVRFVIHANMPGNLEAWYQEIGRAGRDGKLSVCKMYVDTGKDVQLQNFFINMSCPPPETVRRFWDWMWYETRNYNVLSMPQKDMAQAADIEEHFISGCISVLRYSKILETEKRGSYIVKQFESAESAPIDWEAARVKRQQKQERLREMLSFCKNNKECRMQSIMKYFGEPTIKNCGKCDVCLKKVVKKV
jgi:ATP-dependent DNA helicase RecQ